MPQEYVYSDFDSTLSIDASGNVITVKDREAVIQSVKHIFSTVSGERVRSPLGSSLISLLFEPITNDTANAIRQRLAEDIGRYEPRIVTSKLQVTPDPDRNWFEVRFVFQVRKIQRTFTFETRLRSFA